MCSSCAEPTGGVSSISGLPPLSLTSIVPCRLPRAASLPILLRLSFARLPLGGQRAPGSPTRSPTLITEEASSALASEILKSQKRRSESEIREIVSKKIRFECTRYKDVGRSDWLKKIKPLKKRVFREGEGETERTGGEEEQKTEKERKRPEKTEKEEKEEEEQEEKEKEEDETQKAKHTQLQASDFVFFCGECGNGAPADRKAFKADGLGGKTWCSQCKGNKTVSNWICKCGMRWHTCRFHREAPDVLRKKKQKEKENRKQGKRKKKTSEQKERTSLVKTNVVFTVAERRKIQGCGLKGSLLGPTLKRKFGHLCTD
jgi:hypothetical protein